MSFTNTSYHSTSTWCASGLNHTQASVMEYMYTGGADGGGGNDSAHTYTAHIQSHIQWSQAPPLT